MFASGVLCASQFRVQEARRAWHDVRVGDGGRESSTCGAKCGVCAPRHTEIEGQNFS
jgi:hypothetical protein